MRLGGQLRRTVRLYDLWRTGGLSIIVRPKPMAVVFSKRVPTPAHPPLQRYIKLNVVENMTLEELCLVLYHRQVEELSKFLDIPRADSIREGANNDATVDGFCISGPDDILTACLRLRYIQIYDETSCIGGGESSGHSGQRSDTA
jgi:hypothetical protein